MAIFPRDLPEVHQFYLDQDELASRLRREDRSPDFLPWALHCEKKWKKEQPALYRTSMREHIEAVKEYLGEQADGPGSTRTRSPKNGSNNGSNHRSNSVEGCSAEVSDTGAQEPEFGSAAGSNRGSALPAITTPFPPSTTAKVKALQAKPKPATTKVSSSSLTVEDIGFFYESQGLVGEEASRELLLYAALGKVHVGIESLSGGGKTFLLDTFLKAFPSRSYEVIQQLSEKALFNDDRNYKEVEVEGKILQRKEMGYLITTEYQKVMNNPFVEEVVKNIAEGKPSRYTRTNKSRDGTETLELIAHCLIYTFAINNKQAKNKRQDAEVARRFLILHTDISEEHIDQVSQEKSQQNFKAPCEFDLEYFRHHIDGCLALSTDSTIINPFLPYLEEILPAHLKSNIKRMSFMPYLGKLISGCTLFHHAERPRAKNNIENADGASSANTQYLFSTLYDTAHTLSLDQSLVENNIQGLSVAERKILDALETEREYSEEEIFAFLPTFPGKAAVVDAAIAYLHEELRQLRLTKPGHYVKEREERMMFDVERALGSARAYMEQHYPTIAKQWKKTCQQELEELL